MSPDFLLDLPFPYFARVTLPFQRNESSIPLRGIVTARVAHVGDADAPIVLEVEPDGWVRPSPIRYRSYKGRLYFPLRDPSGRDLAADKFLELCRLPPGSPELKTRGASFLFPRMAGRSEGEVFETHPAFLCSESEYRSDVELKIKGGNFRWLDDNRDEAMGAAARLFTEELLVVDGVVWTSRDAREPCWTVDIGYPGAKGPCKVSLLAPQRPIQPLDKLSFPVDRLDDAVRFAKEAWLGLPGIEPEVRGSLLRIERFGSRRDELVEAVSAVLAVTFAQPLPGTTEAAAESLVRLKEMAGSRRREEVPRPRAELALGLFTTVEDGAGAYLRERPAGRAIKAALRRLLFEREFVLDQDDLGAIGLG